MDSKSVLLVEDNEDNRTIYGTVLRFAGYTVLEAINGEEGVAKARSHHPDLILMDLSMPVLDGWQATEQIKSDPYTADIPILAVSAHTMYGTDTTRLVKCGFHGFLAKPLPPRALLCEVQRCMPTR